MMMDQVWEAPRQEEYAHYHPVYYDLRHVCMDRKSSLDAVGCPAPDTEKNTEWKERGF